MKYELRPFQSKAVQDLLLDIDRSINGYYPQRPSSECASCGLSAVTGAGKTIMAAAAIEALFNGSDEFGIPADPHAAVLWVTDSPSLNEQTKKKFLAATDIEASNIITIDNAFTQTRGIIEEGKIYFLNRQLLGAGKMLTRGGETLTFWQVLQDTYSSGVHLLMFLDEAHRGLGKKYNRQDASQLTIYQQIIDGTNGTAPMPIVVGLSATIQRFKDAMNGMRARRTPREPVSVRPSDVRESGLLKDKVILEVPKQTDAVQGMYLTEACAAFKEDTQLWGNWNQANPHEDAVIPLFVVQVQDRITDVSLAELCREIYARLPMLDPARSFANVFGEHENITLGSFQIPYVEPEDVQEMPEIRVLFAKEAISTGWDCPRAEVIYSMRTHSDFTYIAQLIGRMVRTPLARRVEVDRLNVVYCFLPMFNGDNVNKVIDYLTKEDYPSGDSVERRIIQEPVNVEWDSSLGVDDAFDSIMMRRRGSQKHNWINGLFGYTGLLARHEIDTAADGWAFEAVYRELTDGISTFSNEVANQKQEMYRVRSEQYTVRMYETAGQGPQEITREADTYYISNARTRAESVLGSRLVNRYFRELKASGKSDMECNISVAAASSVQSIAERVTEKAKELLDGLQDEYSKAIANMDEKVRSDFESDLFRNGIARLVMIRKPTKDVYEGKNAHKIAKHLMNNPQDHHLAPFDESHLNALERDVVSEELRRGAVAWYRNPSHGGTHALSIPYMSALYESSGLTPRSMYPDFIFFERVGHDIKPYLIDPHGAQLADSVEKLKGFAEYAEEFGEIYSKIWSLTEIMGTRYYLDLKDQATRDAIKAYHESTVLQLYQGPLAHIYQG